MLFFVTELHEYNNLLKIHTNERLIEKLGIDINPGGSNHSGSMLLHWGNVNNNSILGGAAAVIVIGLITYIAINKRIAD